MLLRWVVGPIVVGRSDTSQMSKGLSGGPVARESAATTPVRKPNVLRPVQLVECLGRHGAMQSEGFLQPRGDLGGGFGGEADVRLLAEGLPRVGVTAASDRIRPRAGEGVGAQGVHKLSETHAVVEGARDELPVVDTDVVRPLLLEGSEGDILWCGVVLAVMVLSSDDATEDHRVVWTCH